MSKKLRILFPYVEAGIGHIMPMRAFVEEFKKKYGDEFEIIETDFFKEANDPDLMSYEQWFCHNVRLFAKYPAWGHFVTAADGFFPVRVASWYMMKLHHEEAFEKAVKQMSSYNADIVFSTHWATNYYAQKCEKKPYTIVYCPDCEFNHVFSYKSDLAIIGTKTGYQKALRDRVRFNEDNLKFSTFLIRNQAFEVPYDKYENRKNLGLPKDNFTICFMEGGYGIGKMEEICKILVKQHRKMTIIAACGKNEELYKEFLKLDVNENVTFVPLPLTNNILPYIAACDLFIGKGGNSIAEPTFFGHPSIITTLSTHIEKSIARFYVKTVKCAMICTTKKAILKHIYKFAKHPELLKPYEDNAVSDHDRYGAGPCVDLVYKEIKKMEAKKNGQN